MEAARAADKRGALDLQLLDMRTVATFCDYFLICHGRSKTHCQAIAEAVEGHMAKQGYALGHREGVRDATWIILDYLHVVVHIFTEEARQFYDLRRLWSTAEETPLPEFTQADD